MAIPHGERSEVCDEDSPEKDNVAREPTGVWRPMTPPDKQETMLIFDWDDTILPTSWLERIHALSAASPLRPEVQRHMTALCGVVSQTLTLATSMGTTIIITNSAPGWVDQSCQLFMPQIINQVRSFQICPKPMHAPLTFKITAFRRECRAFKNVVSVGDGNAERTASLRLQQGPERKNNPNPTGAEIPDSQRRVKSVKLIELPTCQQLIAEHEMLQIRLSDVVAFKGCLDLKSRFAPGSTKTGMCTLAHFACGPNNFPTGGAVQARTPQEDVPRGSALTALRVLRPRAEGQLPPLGRLHLGT